MEEGFPIEDEIGFKGYNFKIKIYSSPGFLVKTINDIEFYNNEYNEFAWNVSGQVSGLFFANLISFKNGKEMDSKITKVLVSN